MILRNTDDLEKLLAKARVPESKHSVWLQDKDREARFATLAFCSGAWMGLVNPRNPRAIERGPGANAPSRKIVKSWLAKGISAEEIATVVRDFQLDAVFCILQTIEQLDFGAGDSSAGFTLWAHDANVDFEEIRPQVPIENLIVDLFVSARPKEQPEVAQYV